MFNKFQRLKPIFSRQTFPPSSTQPKFKFASLPPTTQSPLNSTFTIFTQNLSNFSSNSRIHLHQLSKLEISKLSQLQKTLRLHLRTPIKDLEQALDKCEVCFNDDFVLRVLERHRCAWRSAFRFFNWVLKKGESKWYSPGSEVYNEVLDTLGRRKRFAELRQVFDEMLQREGLVNHRTFVVSMCSYATGICRTSQTLDFHLFAYRMLLMSLRQCKHVEAADAHEIFNEMKRPGCPPNALKYYGKWTRSAGDQ